MNSPLISRSKNKHGATQFHLNFDSAWDGFDSFVNYLQKHWRADISEQSDSTYSRRWVLRVGNVPVSVYYDSQIGIFFVREDGNHDDSLLERIESDLLRRMS